MAGGGGGEGKRSVKLFCPTVSKVVAVVARDEQRLDLGSIARAFGLEPATLKLNGHFISRGVDLIASSVTWKSLLSFFSSKGLSTGTNGSDDALLVDGKLYKLGSKRAHESGVFEYGTSCTNSQGYNCVNGKHQLEDMNLSTNKRSRDSVIDTGHGKVTEAGAFWLKRKHCMEGVSLAKRIRRNEVLTSSGSQRTDNGHSGTLSKMQFPCSFIGVNKKRLTEEEMMTAAPRKKIRG